MPRLKRGLLDPAILWQTDSRVINQNCESVECSHSRANSIFPIRFLRDVKVDINRLPTNLVCNFQPKFITNIRQYHLRTFTGKHPCFSLSLSPCRAGDQRHFTVESSCHRDSSLALEYMNALTSL